MEREMSRARTGAVWSLNLLRRLPGGLEERPVRLYDVRVPSKWPQTTNFPAQLSLMQETELETWNDTETRLPGTDQMTTDSLVSPSLWGLSAVPPAMCSWSQSRAENLPGTLTRLTSPSWLQARPESS